MTTVVIERGDDAVEVGDSAEVAAARIDGLLALRGEGRVGEISIGTDAGDERVEVRAQDTLLCQQPALFERVRSLSIPRATGSGPLGVSLFAYGTAPVLSAKAGAALPSPAVAAWERLCPPGEPVNSLRLIDDTLSVEAIQASDLPAVRSRLLEGSLAGLKIKLGYLGKQPVLWDPTG